MSAPDSLGSTEMLAQEEEEQVAVVNDPGVFLSANELPTAYVTMPKRQGRKPTRVKVRGIRSRERAEIEKRLEERRGKAQTKEMNLALFREWLIIYGAVKEDGSQLFGTEHLKALQNMPSGDIVALADGIMKLSGMTDDDVDDLVGNSESSRSIN